MREVSRLVCEAASNKGLGWPVFKRLLAEHASSKPPAYARNLWKPPCFA